MKSFKQFVKEERGAGSGVDFEWAIVYWSLKSAGYSDEELLKRNQKLHPYGGKTDTDAKKAVSNVPQALHKTAKHSDELHINGNPEPKTDICFGSNNEYKVSVKMAGAVQLASGEGKSSAATLNAALAEYYKINPITDQKMVAIIDKIAKMPTKMLTKSNLNKAKEKSFKNYQAMVDSNGEILPEFDWEKFKSENRQLIIDTLKVYVGEHPDFLYILIHEALTGARVFNNGAAAANYMITPKHFLPIDDSYVKSVIPKVKIDMRAKSRSGITSATLRFDYKAEGKFFDFLKNVVSGIKSFFAKILNSLFNGKGEYAISIPID